MSKIIATDNFKTKNWSIQYEDLSSHYADLQIGFTEDAPIVEFTNLQFGFTLTSNGEIVDEQSYPPKNVKYIRSDQKYLINHRLKFKPDTYYSLFLWAENASIRIEHTELFKTPKPPQPYPSWSWDGETWNSPVPYPDDTENYYEWNEDEQEWQLLEEVQNGI